MPLAFDSLNHGIVAFGFFNIDSDMLLLEQTRNPRPSPQRGWQGPGGRRLLESSGIERHHSFRERGSSAPPVQGHRGTEIITIALDPSPEEGAGIADCAWTTIDGCPRIRLQ